MARPFLKWVGGKRQLADEITFRFRDLKMATYFEPFVGGGAVFWKLAEQGRLQRAVLSDWNTELIDCYRAIRDFPDDLLDQLSKLKVDKDIFEELRKAHPSKFSPCRRAARLIYLNKTCFNGLFRVNKSGLFNAPWGKYENPTIYEEAHLRECSEILNDLAILRTGDFAEVLKKAKENDSVYLDPPYIPLNLTSNFTSYTAEGFGQKDHERLAAAFRELVERGCQVIASNSDTELTRALYNGFDMVEVQAGRSINSKGDGRGKITELLIIGG